MDCLIRKHFFHRRGAGGTQRHTEKTSAQPLRFPLRRCGEIPLRKCWPAVALSLLTLIATIVTASPQTPETISGTLPDTTAWRVNKPASWNGTLILDLDGGGANASNTVKWLLAHGYAYGGTTRGACGYDFPKCVNNLLTVRQTFIEKFQEPTRTIAMGGSRGAFVARLALELQPKIFAGALVFSGGGAGSIAVLNAKLDTVWALKTLVNPDAPLPLVNITDVNAANTTLKANEAIDLSVKFSGRANLKLVDHPQLGFPPDFESYDPKVVDHITVNGGGMSGSREFQFLVIPRHEGDYTVGPITYSYFDPGSGQYKRMSSDALHFTVQKGDGSAANVQRPSHTDVQQLDHDIRYIRTGDLRLEPLGHHLFGSLPWIAGMVAPPLALVLFAGWYRRRERMLADTQGLRRKGADKVARQRLKAAEQALNANDREAFYTAMGKALEGYFADKFNLGVAEVNADTVRNKLGHLENGAVAEEYVRQMSELEMARFAPFETRTRQAAYDEAASIIRRIENQL